MYSISLVMLVTVVLVVAATMVFSLARFVAHPDPAVKAGPMYFTIAFTTAAALLMLVLSVNASFAPAIPARRVPDLQLITLALAVTGMVVGLLSVGSAANSYVMRLVLAGIAFMFIMMQSARRTRAREAAAAGQATSSTEPPQPRARSRQRRGGRKR